MSRSWPGSTPRRRRASCRSTGWSSGQLDRAGLVHRAGDRIDRLRSLRGHAAMSATRLDWRDWVAVSWIIFTRGLPGALFVIAGSAGDRNVMWAAAAVLLAGLVIGPILKRVSSPKHSV